MSVDCECVVIGAGVVGLAIAARLAQQGREVIIVEAQADVGSVTSARNSEVIHAGIYYSKDSLKARFCVQGKQQLYDYCQQRHIPFKRCGKLIVATNNPQLERLGKIKARAFNNGVQDIELLSHRAALAIEPQLHCIGALLSPSTGILDSHAFMVSLLGDAENHGAVLACRTAVHSVNYVASASYYQLAFGNDQTNSMTARIVINAAGHGACALANSVFQNSERHDFTAIMSKGNYFSLSAKAPFSRLVYPVPEEGGLGVHLTLDMAGRARFGPDVEPIEHEDYSVDQMRAQRFYAAIRQYWPALPDNTLLPDYSGIRPQVSINGQLYPDFLVHGPDEHGMPGLVNLLGIESPGLTASLAIADDVALQLM